jgi:hypothetical protein
LAGAGLGAALGAAVFLLAALVYDRVLLRRSPPRPPARFAQGGEPRGAIRVLATVGGGGPAAVILPLREDGAETDPDEALLDAALFPDGPLHRWARLLVANPRDAAPLSIPLDAGAIVVAGSPGPAANADLAAAVEARAPSLSPHRLLDLRVAHAADGAVEVPPGGFVRLLLAFPRETNLRTATGAEIRGGIRLHPREVVTESLRAALVDGRTDRLADADRAEAPLREGRQR